MHLSSMKFGGIEELLLDTSKNKHMTDITYEDYIAYLRKIVENYDKDMANQKLVINKQQLKVASEYMSEEGLKAHYIVIDELGNVQGI